jgi:hypothetical protein
LKKGFTEEGEEDSKGERRRLETKGVNFFSVACERFAFFFFLSSLSLSLPLSPPCSPDLHSPQVPAMTSLIVFM